MTLSFVDPSEMATTYRCVIWASPGEGKSVAAASAPSPILVVSADRPTAYVFARRHHNHTPESLRETRYTDRATLDTVKEYLQSPEGLEVRTVVLDPVSNIYDHLVDTAPRRSDGEPDYVVVNKQLLGFIRGLRAIDVNVVLVAHERLNEGKRGDNKLYPAIGGPALINKVLAEMDIVAHVERYQRQGDDGELSEIQWIAQIQPTGNMVGKDSTDALGDRRVADLSRWFELANEANGVKASTEPRKPSSDHPTPVVDDSPYVGDDDHAEPHVDRGGKDTRTAAEKVQRPELKEAATGLKWAAIKDAYGIAQLTPPARAADAFTGLDDSEAEALEGALKNRRLADLYPGDISYDLSELAPPSKQPFDDSDLPWADEASGSTSGDPVDRATVDPGVDPGERAPLLPLVAGDAPIDSVLSESDVALAERILAESFGGVVEDGPSK